MLKLPNRLPALLAIALVSACGQSASERAQDPALSDSGPTPLPPESISPSTDTQANTKIPHPCAAADAAREEIRRLRERYTDNHPEIKREKKFLATAEAQCLPAFGRETPSGNWIIEGGVRVCDGYLVRDSDREYCAAEVPEDWVPREFDGQTYYVQPLKSEG